MDPQQRLQLESAYEALENAGLPIKKVVGTKTAVYVGVFNKDYTDTIYRDTEQVPLYYSTGNGQAILSNRVSYFFDLKGPSVTVDTACSGSLVAMHLACQSIRTGEADQAIVGGTNLIFNPDVMISMSLLGFLNPEGKSYTFDDRANGYGRGEGCATVILKPLETALRDGDPIRAIIRGTGVNSDGRTTGITLPSREAQENLMRSVYKKAGLDPRDTGYFEAHGTGTQAGDPIEMTAIQNVFGPGRHKHNPLIVGSVKTNIGHLEGASGLAGVIKAVLCLEKGLIPPNLNFERPNKRIPIDRWNLKIPITLEKWSSHGVRRASVNSFGYGGTNAHVILDEARTYPNGYSCSFSGMASPSSPHNLETVNTRKLFLFTANDNIAGEAMIRHTIDYLKSNSCNNEQTLLRNLAFTLSEKRTMFPYKLAVSASTLAELIQELENENTFRRSLRMPRLGFVFTGQGAQWARMGVELCGAYPVFNNTLLKADIFLAQLGCSWHIIDELRRDKATSRIHEPKFSQPVCTAVQIALVDLLRSWHVEPSAVVGHSSGEIAAAYAAGALSLESAMLAAYYRGLLSSQMAALRNHHGSMIAVGLSAEETEKYIAQVSVGKMNIACYNSPQSVTVSGDSCAILELERLLQTRAVFSRLLKVNNPASRFQPQTVVDLPPYPWNHSTRYWHESRISHAYRHRKDARHDLLGAPVADFNPIEPRWRGFIRTSELPWVKDHKVQQNILYPAAGMITMAIEAMQQTSTRASVQVVGFRLRDINLSKAITVPENNEGVEITFTLRPLSTSSVASSDQWYEFRLFSTSGEDVWTEHCRGCVAAITPSSSGEVDSNREIRHKELAINEVFATHKQLCENPINIKEMYGRLDNIGLSYGPAFQNFVSLRSSKTGHISLGLISVPDTTTFMPHRFEYPYILHPATLDSVIQTIFPALTAGGRELENPLVPTFIKYMTISNSGLNIPGKKLKVASSATWKGYGHATASITVLADEDSIPKPLIEVKDLRCSSIPHTASTGKTEPRKLCFNMIWDEDIDLINFADAKYIFPSWDRDEELSSVISTLEATAFLFLKRALREIKPAEIVKMQTHHQLFYQSMKRVSDKVAKGEMPHQTSKWISATEQEQQGLIRAAENSRAEGRLLCRVGENLARILRKEIDPLALMMEGDLLYEAYRTAFGMDRCYEQVAAIIDKLANKRPDMKILEVGAGTGAITLPILHISYGFFERARVNFEQWSSLMDFKRLDIEGAPDIQGFAAGSYDLIIASNVLHATSEIRKTLHNIRKLLRPGGKLILLELTHMPLRLAVIFGNLPGWWLGAKEGRTSGPALNEVEWEVNLRSTSFSGLDICLRDFPDEIDHSYSTILTTAVEETQPSYPECVIVNTFFGVQVSVDDIIESIEALSGSRPALCGLESPPQIFENRVCIFLDELSKPVLYNVKRETYESIRRMIYSSKGVLWLTRGATIESINPELSLISGLLRTIRSEEQSKKFVTLDLDAIQPLSDKRAAEVVVQVFRSAFQNVEGFGKADFEFSERDGRVKIPRIVEDVASNNFIARETRQPVPELQSFDQPGRSLKLELGIPGLFDTLRFVEDPAMQREELLYDEVEIKVIASGLNFRDLMVAMGQLVDNYLGSECSGIIARVGRNITYLKAGDRVCTWTFGACSSYVRVPGNQVQLIPEDMSFEGAASLPVAHCSAYLSIVDTARLQKGETILIHSAAGGIGQAAIMLSKWIGAEIFVTTSTLQKKHFIMNTYGIPEDHIFDSRDVSFADGVLRMTNGKGVDVILNSLSGELLRESWNCIAMFGRFVELGKKDMVSNSRLEMGSFIKNVTFFSVNIEAVFRHRQPLGAALMARVMELVRTKVITHISPFDVYPISRVEDAFQAMQTRTHLGKVIIVTGSDEQVKVLPTPTHAFRLREDASYLLVGGLGGLGRSVASWMVENGAKNLIFVSRSGADKPEAAILVEKLKQDGTNIAVHKCDLSDLSQLIAVMESSRRLMPPIRGIIHGGMVLNDSIFRSMSYDKFQDALRPKVTGTQILYALFANMDLDFFVMLSSSAGIVGTWSQGNYTAGSTFQDAFARHGATKRLPIVTLDLGPIASVGFVAENQEYAARVVNHSLFVVLSEAEFLTMLKHAILEPRRTHKSCQIITRLVTPGTGEGTDSSDAPFWFHDARVSHLFQMNRAVTREIQTNTTNIRLRDALPTAETLADAASVVCDSTIAKIASMLAIPVESIDPTQFMATYGFDSLAAVELRNWLYRETKADVAVFDVLGKRSLMELASDVALKSPLLSPIVRKEAATLEQADK
ncbi:hypothetical protein VTN00DRAFT_6365 [Thermoascus crustaceus]|uniref:uncharacterized protein n=1 Tax=Thermoascus crustaceus TaxID=5088 RepID=UPI0037428117